MKNSQSCDPGNIRGIHCAVDPSPTDVCGKTRITTPIFSDTITCLDGFNGPNCTKD